MGKRNKPDEPWITNPEPCGDLSKTSVASDGGLSSDDSLTGSSNSPSQISTNSLLVGSTSGDLLIGSSGNDTLIGNQEGSSLWGGEGCDVFVVQNKVGLDHALDFTDGQDKLLLADGLQFNQLSIVQQGSDTLISFNSTPLMLLHNTSSSLITAADIVSSQPL